MVLRFDAQEAQGIASLLSPLGNPNTLLVLEGILQGLTPAQIAAQCMIPRSTVQQQLSTLVDKGYLTSVAEGYTATRLGGAAATWIARKVAPRASDYLRLMEIGRDLRNVERVGDSIVKLSMAKGDGYLEGLEIVRELEDNWVSLASGVVRVFQVGKEG